MPFGLKSAPASFQHVVDIILSSIKWHSSIVCHENIEIFSRVTDQYIKQTLPLLDLSEEAVITLKSNKCAFFMEKIDFPGHIIWLGLLAVVSKTTDAIRDLRMPTVQSKLRSPIGSCDVFCLFPTLACFVSPLIAKQHKIQASERRTK